MKKPKPQTKKQKLIDEYNKARKNLIRNIKSLEQRGYILPENYIPAKPKNISQGSINKIKKYNDERYRKASIVDYTRPIETEDGVSFPIVKGARSKDVEKDNRKMYGKEWVQMNENFEANSGGKSVKPKQTPTGEPVEYDDYDAGGASDNRYESEPTAGNTATFDVYGAIMELLSFIPSYIYVNVNGKWTFHETESDVNKLTEIWEDSVYRAGENDTLEYLEEDIKQSAPRISEIVRAIQYDSNGEEAYYNYLRELADILSFGKRLTWGDYEKLELGMDDVE